MHLSHIVPVLSHDCIGLAETEFRLEWPESDLVASAKENWRWKVPFDGSTIEFVVVCERL
ncbi:CIC11C00000004163 [Sungouiella intermedia]|uniref:CIC11C00000004163 n=1 Tax=Sungouiella intermedia TaxID=45354 RepID=A0A1L0BMT2_9ASCO|nr:CIC11C00000004163 [[Candida] intermedia]